MRQRKSSQRLLRRQSVREDGETQNTEQSPTRIFKTNLKTLMKQESALKDMLEDRQIRNEVMKSRASSSSGSSFDFEE